MPSARKYSGQRSTAARKIAAAQLPCPCSVCGRTVTADMQWQADHLVPRVIAEAQGWDITQIDSPSNIAPAHRSCNERSGAKLGNIHKATPTPAPVKIARVERPKLSFESVFPVPLSPPRNPSLTCGNDSQEPTE